MRCRTHRLSCLALTLLGATALAFEGTNGFTADEVFSWGAARGAVSYDASFTGVRWADLMNSHLGTSGPQGPGGLASDGAGELFFVVTANDAAARTYTGLVHHDGTKFVHLVQAVWDNSTPSSPQGSQYSKVRVSPVTAGRLTAGHPVIVRAGPATGPQLVSIDPTTSPATETLVWVGAGAQSFDIAPDGTIYRLAAPEIRTSTYNAATGAYDDGVVPTTFEAGHSLRVGPDGALYAFSFADASGSTSLGGQKARVPIFRIDPVTGAWSQYAQVQGNAFIQDWAWDSPGSLWIGLWDTKKGTKFVTEVVAGEVTSSRNAISQSMGRPADLAAGPDGTLFVLEPGAAPDGALDAIYRLTPSGDGGAGGGGGGKGGKGKKK